MLERVRTLVGTEPVSLDLLGRLPEQGTNYKSLRKVSQSRVVTGAGLVAASTLITLD